MDGSILVLQLLLLEKVFRSIRMVFHSTLSGIDRPELAARATVYGLVTNILLNVPLTYAFGIVGAAVATATSVLVSSLFHLTYVRSYVTLTVPWRDIGWIFASAILMTGVVTLMKRVIATRSMLSLTAVVIIGGLIYGLLMLARRSTRGRVLEVIDR
jgi:O-antigen/teichoic acid export membrane protein